MQIIVFSGHNAVEHTNIQCVQQRIGQYRIVDCKT